MKKRFGVLIAAMLVIGCGGGTPSSQDVGGGEPPVVVPPPAPKPPPDPVPPPPPIPDPFVYDATFQVRLHKTDGMSLNGVSLSIVRFGVEVQKIAVQDGFATLSEVLPGEAEIHLLDLSLLHTFEPMAVTIDDDHKHFDIVISLRDHGHTVLFGDSNTSEGGKIPTTFRKHLQEHPSYVAALNGYEVAIDNLAKGGIGLTDVWGDDATYGAHLVRKYFDRLDREGGKVPLFALYRFGLIDVRNRWHPDDFEEELRGIVELALSHGVIPVLNYVSYQKGGRDEAAIDQCNEIYRRVAEEYDAPLVDTALQWSEDLYYEDGEHQSDAGNEVLAAAAAEVIARWLTTSH